MIKKIQDKSIEEMFKQMKKINDCSNNSLLGDENYCENITKNSTFVKYTNINSQYKMLESDSLYVFCSELSNDYSENKSKQFVKPQDTYISSFYFSNNSVFNPSDVYSQWMGYCKEGGVSLDFYFGQDFIGFADEYDEKKYAEFIGNRFINATLEEKNRFNYSLLCNDSTDKAAYYLYPNFPFPVQYYANEYYENDNLPIETIADECDTRVEELLPYFKHCGFVQENEARLAFINTDNRLAKCIKFIDKADGTKIPYIEIKFGDSDNDNKPCELFKQGKNESLEESIFNNIEKLSKFRLIKYKPIVIPQGYNQEEVYNCVEKCLNKISPDLLSKHKISIICQGHLPITKITVAPTNDRREQRKMLEIYCKSKYWLRNVEICESKIPYNTVNNNHI